MSAEYVKFKTFEEMKKEFGDKFEECMYESNIELLIRINDAINDIDEIQHNIFGFEETNWIYDDLSKVVKKLKG